MRDRRLDACAVPHMPGHSVPPLAFLDGVDGDFNSTPRKLRCLQCQLGYFTGLIALLV